MTTPIGGRKRVYTEEERKVIDPFKTSYMETTTPAERKSIAQVDIFPALFTYWSSIGVDLNADETNRRTEVCYYFSSIYYLYFYFNIATSQMVEERLAGEKKTCKSWCTLPFN